MHFSEAFKHLESETKELKHLLLNGAVVKAYAAPLPILSQFERRSPETGGYEPEGHFHGKLATEVAIQNICSYFAAPGTHTFHVRLCPGIIQVKHALMLEVERRIGLINSYKKQFSQSVAEIADKRVKHEEIHALLPMLMTKQVDRKINYIPASDSLLSISFTLASKTDQSVISYEEALALCTDVDSSKRLSNHNGCELRIRRPKTKRFYANCLIDIPDSKKNRPLQLQGGIPIIGSNKADEPIKVREFVPNKKNMAKRASAAQYVLICPTHHIYAMMPNL